MEGQWTIQSGWRDERNRIIREFHHDSGYRAEVSIASDTLDRDFPTADTLEAKSERTEWVLHAMLDQFCEKHAGELKRGCLITIDESQIDLYRTEREWKNRNP